MTFPACPSRSADPCSQRSCQVAGWKGRLSGSWTTCRVGSAVFERGAVIGGQSAGKDQEGKVRGEGSEASGASCEFVFLGVWFPLSSVSGSGSGFL